MFRAKISSSYWNLAVVAVKFEKNVGTTPAIASIHCRTQIPIKLGRLYQVASKTPATEKEKICTKRFCIKLHKNLARSKVCFGWI